MNDSFSLAGSQLQSQLRQMELELDGQDIADIVYLAAMSAPVSSLTDDIPTEEIDEETTTRPSVEPPPVGDTDSGEDIPSEDEKGKPQERDLNGQEDNSKNDKPTKEPIQARLSVLSTVQDGGKTAQGVSAIDFASPDARAVPNLRFLARALRFLPRAISDPTQWILDEEATVAKWAEQMVLPFESPLVPELKMCTRRWAEVVLIVDNAPTMQMWREVVEELAGMLRWQGAFRQVGIWEMDTVSPPLGEEGEFPSLYSVASPLQPQHAGQKRSAVKRSYGELLSPRQDRIVVVLTDAMSLAWQDGRAFGLLQHLGTRISVALWHLLPESLWGQSAVGVPRWLVQSGVPNPLNHSLIPSPRPGAWSPLLMRRGFDLSGAVPLPVITLNPRHMESWARLQAGLGGGTVPALVLRPDLNQPKERQAFTQQAASPIPPEKVLARFREQGSSEAKELARLLTVVPLTLPIIRLVQRAMMPLSTQEHLAEFLCSGLIGSKASSTTSDADALLFEWVSEGVRDDLNARLSGSDAVAVLRSVGEFLGVTPETSRQFATKLQNGVGDDSVEGLENLSSTQREFAILSEQTLRTLGYFSDASNDDTSRGAVPPGEAVEAKKEDDLPPSAPVPVVLPRKALRIFVSGSPLDLRDERRAVVLELDLLSSFSVSAVEWPRASRENEVFVETLLSCDAMVLLIGQKTHSGGVVREYEACREATIPCFAYSRRIEDSEEIDLRLAELLKQLGQDGVIVTLFEGPESLVKAVRSDILSALIRGVLAENFKSLRLDLSEIVELCLSHLEPDEKEHVLRALNYVFRSTEPHFYEKELVEGGKEMLLWPKAFYNSDSGLGQMLLPMLIAVAQKEPTQFRELTVATILSAPLFIYPQDSTPRILPLNQEEHEQLVEKWQALLSASVSIPSGFILQDQFDPDIGRIHRLSWHPRNHYMALPGERGTLDFWSPGPLISSSPTPATMLVSEAAINQVVWSADGDSMALASSDGVCRIYGARRNRLDTNHKSEVLAVAWSPDGSLIATGSQGGSVRLFDAETGKQTFHHFFSHMRSVTTVGWRGLDARSSSQEECLAFAGKDGLVGKVLASYETTILQRFEGAYDADAYCLAWIPGTYFFVTGMRDGRLLVWDASSERMALEIPAHSGPILGVSVSAAVAGKPYLMATKSADDTVALWEVQVEPHLVISKFPGALAEPRPDTLWSHLAFDPAEPDVLATMGNRSEHVRIWRIQREQLEAPTQRWQIKKQASEGEVRAFVANQVTDSADSPVLETLLMAREDDFQCWLVTTPRHLWSVSEDPSAGGLFVNNEIGLPLLKERVLNFGIPVPAQTGPDYIQITPNFSCPYSADLHPDRARLVNQIYEMIMGPQSSVELKLWHQVFRDPAKDGRFDFRYSVYQFRVGVEAPPEVLEQIQFVEYALPPAWPSSSSPRIIENRDTSFEMRDLAWGNLEVQATIHFRDGRASQEVTISIVLGAESPFDWLTMAQVRLTSKAIEYHDDPRERYGRSVVTRGHHILDINQDFNMGHFLVTNELYALFVAAEGYYEDQFWSGVEPSLRSQFVCRDKQGFGPAFWPTESRHPWGQATHPVTGICYFEAVAFIRWLQKEHAHPEWDWCLPAENMWEVTARTEKGFRYPWGNEFQSEFCNSAERGEGKTTPVNWCRAGRSASRCFDMAGNVWEFVEGFTPNPNWCVLRGGSFQNNRGEVQSHLRLENVPRHHRPRDFGFRCAQRPKTISRPRKPRQSRKKK